MPSSDVTILNVNLCQSLHSRLPPQSGNMASLLQLSQLSIKCLICSKIILEATNRYIICGKGNVDFAVVLKSLDLPFEGKEYICKSCNRKFEKHERIAEHFMKSADEIRKIVCGTQQSLKRVARDPTSVYASSSQTNNSVAMKKQCVTVR